jgi:hypothetical protein
MTLVAATLIYMAQSEGSVHLNHGNKINNKYYEVKMKYPFNIPIICV